MHDFSEKESFCICCYYMITFELFKAKRCPSLNEMNGAGSKIIVIYLPTIYHGQALILVLLQR